MLLTESFSLASLVILLNVFVVFCCLWLLWRSLWLEFLRVGRLRFLSV